jgi:hypothetical protein
MVSRKRHDPLVAESARANNSRRGPGRVERYWVEAFCPKSGGYAGIGRRCSAATRERKEQISAVALRGGITFSSAVLKHRQLTLKGTSSSYGPVEVTGSIEGPALRGAWRAGSTGGALIAERKPTDTSASLRLKVFEEVAQAVQQDYFDPGFGGLDWRSIAQRYRRLAQNLQSDGALFRVVNQMLGELKTSHLQFALGASETAVESSPEEDAAKAIEWRAISRYAGYLKIASFLEGAKFLALIDRAFADLEKLPGLLIDLRGNGGGNLGGAMRLGDHLFDQPQPAGFFATRLGLERNRARTIDELDPTKLSQYTGYDVNGFYSMLRQSGAVALSTGGRSRFIVEN